METISKIKVTETHEVPMILNGRLVFPREREAVHHLDYETGIRVTIPVMTEADLAEVVDAHKQTSGALARLSTDEVTLFLAAVATRWIAGESPAKKRLDAVAHRITGFAPGMLASDYDHIAHFLEARFHIWDTIAAELGNERIFDEWIPNQMVHVRAFPRGLLVQYLVGNLPLAGLYTVIRGIITRNSNLLKLPSRDPMTVLGFVEAMLEVDPEHPVSRALSVAYWPHDAKVGKAALQAADAVCVWGGGEAVERVKREVRANVPVSDYGPRWSCSAIDLTKCDPEEAAIRLVDDVAFYDQEACFNTQRVFVRGDHKRFREYLKTYFEAFDARYPLTSNRDALAHRASTLLEARYLGLDVEQGASWATIVAPSGANDPRLTHPLGRTLFIHPTDNFEIVSQYLDTFAQTVSVFPSALANELRDELSLAGACRIVCCGWSRMPRQGFTHDAIYGLHPLIRLVTVERPREDFGKYYNRPLDPKTWTRKYLLGERWWSDPWWARVRDPSVIPGGRDQQSTSGEPLGSSE